MFVVNIFAVPKKIIKQDGFFFFLNKSTSSPEQTPILHVP